MDQRSGFPLISILILAVLLLWLGPYCSAQSAKPPPPPTTASPKPAQTTVVPDVNQSSVTIFSSTEGVDFGPYVRKLLKSIKESWYLVMPRQAGAGVKGKAGVVFTILPNGALSADNPKVEMPSGVDVFDKAAVDAIRNSVPFDPLPQQFHGPYLKLRIIFLYNLPTK